MLFRSEDALRNVLNDLGIVPHFVVIVIFYLVLRISQGQDTSVIGNTEILVSIEDQVYYLGELGLDLLRCYEQMGVVLAEMWNNAEDALRKVLNDLGIEYTEEIGEAAFYGPKLDVNVKPAVGNEYTLSTCQLDFCLPAKFNLTYVDKDGQKKTPVVLHRAILGSLDRFMAYILEETKGNLPLWLAPVQAMILPVKNDDEELNAYAHDLYGYLLDNNIRADIDERAEKLGYRVREAQVKKIPYLIILGKQEAQDGTVSYRLHGQQNTTTVSKDEFLAMLKDEIATKKLSK